MSFQQQVMKGLKWTSAATIAKGSLQIAILAIAAKFLSASEFAIYAIVQITLGFSQVFMDMGLGNALIQRKEIKANHYAELFTLNFIIAIFVAAIVYFSAGFVADFFDNVEATFYIQLVSISFVLSALFRIHLASLQKALNFNLIAKIEILAQLGSFSVAVYVLVIGGGVVALIIGYLVNLFIQCIGFWVYSPNKLRIQLPQSYQDLKGYFHFGFYQTSDATVNYFNSQFDLILVGKLLGNEALGGYVLIRQLVFKPAMVINPILTRVAFPAMSKLQSNDSKLSEIYCKMSGALALINFPIYIVMFVFAEMIIKYLFSEAWLHLTPIMQLMAVWCLVRSTMNPVGSLMMALGKVKQLFYWNLSLLAVVPLSIWLGSIYHLEGVVSALLLLQGILFVFHLFVLLGKLGHIQLGRYLKKLASALLISVQIITFSLLAHAFTASEWVNVGFTLMLFTIVYAVYVFKMRKHYAI